MLEHSNWFVSALNSHSNWFASNSRAEICCFCSKWRKEWSEALAAGAFFFLSLVGDLHFFLASTGVGASVGDRWGRRCRWCLTARGVDAGEVVAGNGALATGVGGTPLVPRRWAGRHGSGGGGAGARLAAGAGAAGANTWHISEWARMTTKRVRSDLNYDTTKQNGGSRKSTNVYLFVKLLISLERWHTWVIFHVENIEKNHFVGLWLSTWLPSFILNNLWNVSVSK